MRTTLYPVTAPIAACAAVCTVTLSLMSFPAAASAQEIVIEVTDAELLHEALYSCKNLARSRRHTIDLGIFWKMLELERRYDVPEAYRGMTIAKACIESGYTPDIAGDCKKPGECKAVGMLQLWPWTKRFGVDRTDPIDSARFLLHRVRVGLQGRRLKRRCPNIQSSLEAFRIAWLRINRGPLTGGRQRCHGTPHGLSRLRQWKNNILRKRAQQRRAATARIKRRRRAAANKQRAWSAVASMHEYRPVRRH